MRRIAFPIMLGVLCAGCTVNQDLMFRTDNQFEFANLSEANHGAYTLAPNDRLQIQLFSNNGQRLIALTVGSDAAGQSAATLQQSVLFQYRVELDGTVELPEVGAIALAGLTLEEAEQKVEEAYATEYVDPYAMVKVVNNRVLVFPGEAGKATVITLENQNTTVIEALALSGGIRERGRSKQIKLLRQQEGKEVVYKMDLSTVEGIEAARTIVQANDIIYVESNPQVVQEVLSDVSPVAQLMTTITSLYFTYRLLISD